MNSSVYRLKTPNWIDGVTLRIGRWPGAPAKSVNNNKMTEYLKYSINNFQFSIFNSTPNPDVLEE